MNIFGLEIRRKKTEIIPVQKSISYGELFSHGLPMEMGLKNVVRPYENIASVYKSIKALCDNVPQAKIQIYNKATEEEADDPRLRLLIDSPNTRQSQSDFIQEWVGFYALYGEGFIKKLLSIGQVTGNANLPGALINLDPSKVKEQVDYSTGLLSGWRIGTMTMKPEELIHTKDFNPYNPFRGMSPLKPIDDEVEIDQASLTFNNAFFKNNATPGLILSTPDNLSKDQREQLKAAIEAKYTSASKAFKTLVLEKGMEPKDAGHTTHKEMDFIEQKKLMREEILGIWRVPKALFNITDDLNYATFMGQMRIFWIYGLMPIMRKFEDSINKQIVMPYNPNLYIAFDYKNIPAFQEDFKERVTTAQILSSIGFTGNEINAMLELGFDETSWRDKWWAPFSMTPVDDSNIETLTNPPEPEPLDPVPQDEQPAEAPAKMTKMDATWEAKKAQFLKMFLKNQSFLEDKFESKVTRYYMELRARYLKLPAEQLRGLFIDINWKEQDDKLEKAIRPTMLEAIKIGVSIGEAVLGKRKHLPDESFEHRVSSYLQIRMDKLTGLNGTVKTRLEDGLRTALQEQIQAGASLQGQVDAMYGAIRDFFNLSANRARLVARTESAGAVNGGSMLYYDNEGVEKKRWVTAHDELVRSSHRACEQEGAISISRQFVNGLDYPGDQANGSAEDVCNCRCSFMPVVE